MKRTKIESKPGTVTVAWGERNAYAYAFIDEKTGKEKGWIRWGNGAKCSGHSSYPSWRAALKAIATTFNRERKTA